ncbi:hypothetical protein BC834DRAFT_630042 [Gloeopeniophorella convolvens]|nr:hypothetical protein BC834DRAFT_630042 [Gloeopeniophorella convolvens]
MQSLCRDSVAPNSACSPCPANFGLRGGVTGNSILLKSTTDAIYLEATATMMSDNNFLLHVPHEDAAKYMHPAAPAGVPCVAVIFARAIVQGKDHGVEPFIVHVHDGATRTCGVGMRVLPQRGGSSYLSHPLIYFHIAR